jgi:hypothetical protein
VVAGVVNHLRTLLLGMPGLASPGSSFFGEEYVPPDYVPPLLPTNLTAIREALFGPGADRAMVNWRLREFLAAVHGDNNLASFATALDPRITYWPFDSSIFDRLLQGVLVQVVQALPNQQLYILSSTKKALASSRLYFRWQLEVLDGQTVRVTQFDTSTGIVEVVFLPYTVSDNLSSVLDLSGGIMQVRFDAGPGAVWGIETILYPSRNPVELANDVRNALGTELTAALFPVGSPEPYQTFGNYWQLDEQAPFQLAGLVLALGYRINDLLTGTAV